MKTQSRAFRTSDWAEGSIQQDSEPKHTETVTAETKRVTYLSVNIKNQIFNAQKAFCYSSSILFAILLFCYSIFLLFKMLIWSVSF